jgi:uncharacterized delta-60 repeat protein
MINASAVTATFYDDTALTPSTVYWYKVVAVKGGQEQTVSDACCGTTAASLGAPQNVKVSYLSVTSLRVSWDALSGIDGYNVYRSASQYGTYLKVNPQPASDVHYDDAALSPSTEYWYRVAALLQGMEQGQSLPVEGYTGQRWAKSYGGDAARSIQPTTDGGYLVVGSTTAFGAGGQDICVLKLAGDGSVSWHKTYGGSADDAGYSGLQTVDGGYVVAGSTASFGAGGSDLWVLKLGPDGTVGWQKCYGRVGDDVGNSIQQTTDGGYIVAGSRSGSGAVWVLKLASDGSVSWQKSYGSGTDTVAYAVQQTADGGYILSGETYVVAGTYLHDAWVLKLASDGSVNWQKRYGGSGDETAFGIRQTADGGYIVVGSKVSSSSGADVWVLKLASDGSVSWQKLYASILGSDYIHYDCGRSVQQTADGGYIVAGASEITYGDYVFWLVKLSSNGTWSWQRRYGGGSADVAYAVQQTMDGGYVMAGVTASFGGAWVLKTPADGQLPGANFLGPGQMLSMDTSVAPTDTSVTPVDTTATANDTTAAGNASSPTVSTQYP